MTELVLCDLTVIVFLTAFPEASVEVSKSKLVLSSLPDVANCVCHLSLSDLGQLLLSGRRQRSVVGVLCWTLCVAQNSRILLFLLNLL